jgi:hypothetical protein
MARGWESKGIEAQQEEASRPKGKTAALSAAERTAIDRKKTLDLARVRAVDDLSRATAPAHRRMLEQAIAALDEQLAQLGSA